MSDLETRLKSAIRSAARIEIARNPSSSTQFAHIPAADQEKVLDRYATWMLPHILPVINAYIEETR